MRKIKFRLRINNKIVGYEKWYSGHQKEGDPCSANPCWLYSKDNKYWTPTYIYHKQKDAYTNVKDKNGKEIYEGDIVTVDNVTYPENRPIEWGFHSDHSTYMFQMGWNIWEEEVVEVIGNVHENPEKVK